MFKVNSKKIRTTSIVSIVDFENINVSWAFRIISTKNQYSQPSEKITTFKLSCSFFIEYTKSGVAWLADHFSLGIVSKFHF